ncbi:MAG: hypothetical protein LUC94_02500, partial [Clostridiales bacterium]|nr:hypothetical protein [Clostridiales bacterium]
LQAAGVVAVYDVVKIVLHPFPSPFLVYCFSAKPFCNSDCSAFSKHCQHFYSLIIKQKSTLNFVHFAVGGSIFHKASILIAVLSSKISG